MRVEERLEELGLDLLPPAPGNNKVAAAVRVGHLVFTSAHPSDERGKLGQEVSHARGYQVAQDATVCCLSSIRTLIGDLDAITRVVKVTGYINTAPGFTDYTQVMHGVTELLLDVFGEDIGSHARSCVGVSELTDNATIEIEMIVEVAE